MLEQPKNFNIKEILKTYIPEVIAIFLGISVSFWFDEWRENRKDRESEQKILKNLKENLVQDSLVLGKTAQGLDYMLHGAEKLIQFKRDADIADSVGFYIDMAASYSAILTNQTAYEEMKQTGNSNLIQDDTLKKAILGHYTGMLPFVNEWCEVDKMHTLNQLIPEMSNYFPVTIDTTGIVPASQKIKYLKTPKLKHLILTNLTYKKEAIMAIKRLNTSTKRLIARINKSLKK